MNAKSIIIRYGIDPNVLLDQNFLDDEKIVANLIGMLDIHEDDVVFEVGAGIGTFTSMLPKCKKIYATEIDKKLCEVLRKEVEEAEVIHGNALDWIDKLPFTKLISSTPYSICEPLMHKLFKSEFQKALVIVPKKFSQIIMKPKTKLGIYSSFFLEMEDVMEIPGSKFEPAPKIGSTAIMITKKPKNLEQEIYLQKDKTVKNLVKEILMIKGITKRQAKEKALILGPKLLEKKGESLDFDDILAIKEFIKTL